LSFPASVARADVSLTNGAGVDVTAEGGGSIVINAKSLDISGSSTLGAGIGEGLGSASTQAGDITLNATGATTVTNSDIFNEVGPGAEGKGGDINIKTQSASLIGSSTVLARTLGQGDAGNVTIETERLALQDGSFISTSIFPNAVGQGGNLTVSASESVELIGTRADGFPSSLLAQTGSAGDGGNLTIETKKLVARDGAGLSTQAFGTGNGGTLSVSASESVELIGTSSMNSLSSGLFSITSGLLTDAPAGNGGALTIETGKLIVRDGAQIEASTTGEGEAGPLKITASESVELRDGAQINAAASGPGNAGSIIINIDGLLAATDSDISTDALQSSGGAINITAGDIRLREDSDIRTNVDSGIGGGGDINVDTDTLVALEDSDITANAFGGPGGRVQINTQGDFRSLDSDITASSELGIDGVVDINTPDVDLQSSLTQLSANFVSPEQVVAGSCLARRNEEQGSFTVTGTGGLPRDPYDAISGQFSVTGVQPIQGRDVISKGPAGVEAPVWKPGDPVQEAQGMVVTADGRTIVGTAPQLATVAKAQDLAC